MTTTMFLDWNRTHEQIIPTAFTKCIRWQAEETLDPLLCLHHYYCDQTYPISYPPLADTCLILFTVTSYLITLATRITEIIISFSAHQTRLRRVIKRYFLPSSPISLSLILFTASQIGNRMDATCSVGPTIFHVVLISAIVFDGGADTNISDIKHVFFDLSIVSGNLHLSLDLDSILVPYYTGYDAVLSSTLSGECDSCMCRQEALVVGGTVVSYRAWSTTAFLVVGVLYSTIIWRSSASFGKLLAVINAVKYFLEMLALVCIVVDSDYQLRHSPPERVGLRVAAFGAQLIFIGLHVLSTIQRLQYYIRKSMFQLQEKHLTA